MYAPPTVYVIDPSISQYISLLKFHHFTIYAVSLFTILTFSKWEFFPPTTQINSYPFFETD